MLEEVLIDAEGEQGGDGVEHGIEGAEDGTDHDGGEKPAEAGWQHFADEGAVGMVAMEVALSVEMEGDDAWQHEQDRREHFEDAGDEHAALAFGEILGGEGPLNDLLIGGPIGMPRD